MKKVRLTPQTVDDRAAAATEDASSDLTLEDMTTEVYAMLLDLNQLNAPNAPTRSRELSVAITHVETGLLWLRAALEHQQAIERGKL